MLLAALLALAAQTGDPQIKTDHPWYPGELACSTFDRLFAHQSGIYKRVTGRDVSAAAVYIALRRLEDGGYVRSSVKEREARGVTRERRYFDVTARGLGLLRTARARYLRLWDGLEPLLGGSR